MTPKRALLHFGVPMNVDTGADEMGHKPSKTAAKVTQKRKELFDEQVNTRLAEVHCLDLAREEIYNFRTIWNYFEQYEPRETEEPQSKKGGTRLGGTKYQVVHAEEDGDVDFRLVVESQKVPAGSIGQKVERPFVDFLGLLGGKVAEYIPNLAIFTTYHHNGVIFRGTPKFNNGVWQDWVMVDWGEDHGKLPNKIWEFVDLRGLPEDNVVQCGGLCPIPPGIYGIVENADFVTDRNQKMMSKIFIPILKEVKQMQQHRVQNLTFYLADVDTFDEPLAVIPDIGGPANAYFFLKKRTEWKADFEKWLESKHETFPNFPDEADQDFGESEGDSDGDDEDSEEDGSRSDVDSEEDGTSSEE